MLIDVRNTHERRVGYVQDVIVLLAVRLDQKNTVFALCPREATALFLRNYFSGTGGAECASHPNDTSVNMHKPDERV